jgi:putative CocE/NonD family hydrolase
MPLGELDPRATQVFVPMRDGIELATDVYLPEGWESTSPDGLPTIVVRLPYDKNDRFAFMADCATRFMAQGYAFVAQDVRGKARSQGETVAFVHEVEDGYDTLEWIAAQPWCDGAIGSFGDSYYGFTQWAMIASGHPALKAAVPRMTNTEIGSDWMYQEGAFNLGTMGEWALHTWVDSSLNELDIDWSVRPLTRLVEHHADGRTSASYSRWTAEPEDSAYWTKDIYAGHPMTWGRIPTLHVGGFFDVFSRGQLADYQRSLAGDAGAHQYLNMGATDHFDDLLLATGKSPDHVVDDSELPRFLDSYIDPAVEFFDVYLKGGSGTIPRVRWEEGFGVWHEAAQWPPAEAEQITWHLSGSATALDGPRGGALAPQPPAIEAAIPWVHDPQDPVPSLIADPWRPLLDLPDERSVESRADVLTFTSAVFENALTLAGPVTADVVVSADAPSTHLIARLCDVWPDGRSTLIVEGITLVSDPTSPREIRIDLGDTGYRVQPEHRLRLQVSVSSFPRWPVHPGTDEDPLTATSTRPVAHELHVGGGRKGHVTLTALPHPSSATSAT